MIRPEVERLANLGRLPDSDAPVDVIAEHEGALSQIGAPVSDEEARVLSTLFGSDECFGLAWTLLHLIETAPGWPLEDVLTDSTDPWIARLREARDPSE